MSTANGPERVIVLRLPKRLAAGLPVLVSLIQLAADIASDSGDQAANRWTVADDASARTMCPLPGGVSAGRSDSYCKVTLASTVTPPGWQVVDGRPSLTSMAETKPDGWDPASCPHNPASKGCKDVASRQVSRPRRRTRPDNHGRWRPSRLGTSATSKYRRMLAAGSAGVSTAVKYSNRSRLRRPTRHTGPVDLEPRLTELNCRQFGTKR